MVVNSKFTKKQQYSINSKDLEEETEKNKNIDKQGLNSFKNAKLYKAMK